MLSTSSVPAPTNLSVAATSSTAAKLKWTDNAHTESGYRVERSTDGKTFTEINVISPDETSYINGKLKAGVTYSYRVRAFDGAGNSDYTNVAAVTMDAASTPPVSTPTPSTLKAPTTLKVRPNSSTALLLVWIDNATSETGYAIDKSVDGVNFKTINTIGPNITSYVNGKLQTGVHYWFRVRAFDDAGHSVSSHSAEGIPAPLVSNPPPTSLPAPTNLKATVTSATAIKLTWTDTTSSEAGFKVERSLDGINFKLLNTVGPNVTSYVNGKLTTGAKYWYRVRAFAATGDGKSSSIVSATPKATETPPPAPLIAPSNLNATSITQASIQVTWKDNANNETGYKIERSTDGKNFTEIAGNVAQGSEVYNDIGLSSNTKYYYRVRAFDATRNSGYSNIDNATTKKPPEPPPPDPDHSWASGGQGDYATGKWWFDGMTITLAADPAQVIPILKELHIGSVRTFLTRTPSWAADGGTLDGLPHAQAYKNAGFKVMMEIGDDAVPTYDEASTYFAALAKNSDLMKSVDSFEIVNEPNRPPFWKGTAQQYVDNVLKAAWDVLHPTGVKIVGAGPTFDVNFCKTLVSFGYLNYCDYANFHPYGSSPEEIYTRATGAIAAFAGKPTIFTEWNIRGTSGKDPWAQKVDATRKLLATTGADSSFYFPLFVSEALAGPGGLINLPDYSKNEPFFDTVKNWGETPIT
jgi:hypothetical protein